jgi:hypothetical protein
MKFPSDKYADYVDHPRFGRGPKITGLDPHPLDEGVHLHWNAKTAAEVQASIEKAAALCEKRTGRKLPQTSFYSHDVRRIPNTAIPADLSRQTPATVAATHYFDLDRMCCDCGRRFIFFAEEQKHWYEELGFGLESDCVRCVECRKREQGLAQKARRYEELFHEPNRTAEQNLEMAECCVVLMESSIFGLRQTQRVRKLLNKVADDVDPTVRSRCEELAARVRLLNEH